MSISIYINTALIKGLGKQRLLLYSFSSKKHQSAGPSITVSDTETENKAASSDKTLKQAAACLGCIPTCARCDRKGTLFKVLAEEEEAHCVKEFRDMQYCPSVIGWEKSQGHCCSDRSHLPQWLMHHTEINQHGSRIISAKICRLKEIFLSFFYLFMCNQNANSRISLETPTLVLV